MLRRYYFDHLSTRGQSTTPIISVAPIISIRSKPSHSKIFLRIMKSNKTVPIVNRIKKTTITNSIKPSFILRSFLPAFLGCETTVNNCLRLSYSGAWKSIDTVKPDMATENQNITPTCPYGMMITQFWQVHNMIIPKENQSRTRLREVLRDGRIGREKKGFSLIEFIIGSGVMTLVLAGRYSRPE